MHLLTVAVSGSPSQNVPATRRCGQCPGSGVMPISLLYTPPDSFALDEIIFKASRAIPQTDWVQARGVFMARWYNPLNLVFADMEACFGLILK